MNPLVSVIIVTWNSAKDIEGCLRSVYDQDYDNFRVVVVDNASTDHTVSIVQKEFPQAELLRSPQNLYFAGGNNLGIRHALESKGTYIAVLNPDTIVSRNWLSAQVEFLEDHADVGIVCPKVWFAVGFGAEHGQKSTENIKYINTAGVLPGGFLFPYDRAFGELDDGRYDSAKSVFAASGVSMFVRANVFRQIGLFYEPMQMYLEDVDLCVRARKAGWDIYYLPTATVEHKHMQSTQQTNSKYSFWSKRNYLLYLARNYSFKKWLRGVWVVSKEASAVTFIRVLGSYFGVLFKSVFNSSK